MKLEFFEPAMCCPTGLCGTSVDERLVRLNENIGILKEKYKDMDIQRYMISQQPLKFAANREVFKLVKDKTKKSLPITTFNGAIIKVGDYPSLEEMVKVIEEAREEK